MSALSGNTVLLVKLKIQNFLFSQLSLSNFQIVVTTVRSCGHEWTHPCHVTEMTTTCLELVDKSSEAICGHGVSMECWQVDELHEGEASLYCKSKCSYYFDPEIGGCGHDCQQNCQVCMESGIHGPCLEPCNRVLFCGHK